MQLNLRALQSTLLSDWEAKLESIHVVSNRRWSSAAFYRRAYTRVSPDRSQLGSGCTHQLMHSIHFDVQGFSRTYWDFYLGAGFTVGVFFLFSAILTWQLGSLPAETLARMRGTAWALVLCFAAVTFLSWKYLFIIPLVFSGVITLCLIAAAWLSSKQRLARAMP